MSDKKMTPSDADKQLSMLSALMNQVRLGWYLLTDGKVSLLTKAIIPAALLYVISPIDIIPDMIPVAGQLDDLGIVMAGVALFIRMCPPELVQYYRDQLNLGHQEATSSSHEITTPPDDEDSIDTTYRVLDE